MIGSEQPKRRTKFISLADAADGSPYSQEYLSLRARQGKLRAEKHGRNWVTTAEWLQEYIQTHEKLVKFISLAEAAAISPYSQEYLSLRARQGKLKSKKQGRNWMTTQEWLAEYEQKYFNLSEKIKAGPPFKEMPQLEKAAVALKPEIK